MAATPEFGFHQLLTHVVGDMARAVCERSGETAQQHYARTQATIHMIMGFLPRDVVELCLSGHCVMLHEMMLSAVHDALAGEPDPMRRSTRSAVVALNKEFNSTLVHLARYQDRPAAGRRDQAGLHPADARSESTGSSGPEPAAVQPHKVPDPQSTATRDMPPRTASGNAASPSDRDDLNAAARDDLNADAAEIPGETVVYHPSSALVAECRGDPEAMAALEAGDPERFTKVLGVAIPGEAFVETANNPGSPFAMKASGPLPASRMSSRPTG
jgi:hypothetical protein